MPSVGDEVWWPGKRGIFAAKWVCEFVNYPYLFSLVLKKATDNSLRKLMRACVAIPLFVLGKIRATGLDLPMVSIGAKSELPRRYLVLRQFASTSMYIVFRRLAWLYTDEPNL